MRRKWLYEVQILHPVVSLQGGSFGGWKTERAFDSAFEAESAIEDVIRRLPGLDLRIVAMFVKQDEESADAPPSV